MILRDPACTSFLCSPSYFPYWAVWLVTRCFPLFVLFPLLPVTFASSSLLALPYRGFLSVTCLPPTSLTEPRRGAQETRTCWVT